MNPHEFLLSQCTSGGCGAKIGPDTLAGVLGELPRLSDKRLLVGYEASDDAAVYWLDGNRSIVSTVDFFSPMVEDPRVFGRIAAANALSDVYAMGATPLLALNLVCFPEVLPAESLADMLRGGAEKLAEAGVLLGGGHSIYDREPKYGLAVTGLVENDRILRNNTPKEGHLLILTKPLGTGIVMAAHRVGQADEASLAAALAGMQRLNKYAAERLAGYEVSACTDVTGFGLLAHLLEMCGQKVSAVLDVDALPVLPGALAYAEEFLLTAAGQRNRNHFGDKGDLSALSPATAELLFDPQTSGGLLFAVDAHQARGLLSALRVDDPWARIIGKIIPREDDVITFAEVGA